MHYCSQGSRGPRGEGCGTRAARARCSSARHASSRRPPNGHPAAELPRLTADDLATCATAYLDTAPVSAPSSVSTPAATTVATPSIADPSAGPVPVFLSAHHHQRCWPAVLFSATTNVTGASDVTCAPTADVPSSPDVSSSLTDVSTAHTLSDAT